MNHIHNASGILRHDPSRTGFLRRRFRTALYKRFELLRKDIVDLVAVEDAFGLKPVVHEPLSLLTGNQRFRFQTTPQQVEAFRKWLAQQIKFRIFGTLTEQMENAWWEQYVKEGYLKGAGRAFDDTKKPYAKGYSEQNDYTKGFYSGSKLEFLKSSFGQPVAIEKVKLLSGRFFTELNGVTEQMATKITRSLTDGLVQGKNPRQIARDLAEEVDDIGIKRANVIAQTEIMRTHAEGQLDAMEAMGVEELGVAVEWSTSDLGVTEKGYPSPCDLCAPLQGTVFSLAEARGLLPRHPNCRCAWIPANVGEKDSEQKSTKREVNQALNDSIRGEMPELTKRTLAEQRELSSWMGADLEVSKKRPTSIFNVRRSLVIHGGPGSGNFGHAGRPGQVGGSAPAGAGGSARPSVSEDIAELKFKGGTVHELQAYKSLTDMRTKANKLLKSDPSDENKQLAEEIKGKLSEIRKTIRDRYAAEHGREAEKKITGKSLTQKKKAGDGETKTKREKTTTAKKETKTQTSARKSVTRQELAKIHFNEGRDGIEKFIDENKVDAGKRSAHGMTKPEKFSAIDIDNTAVYFTDKTRTAAIRSITDWTADTNLVSDKLWKETHGIYFSSQRNSADKMWAVRYGMKGFRSAATGGDGSVVVYSKGVLTTGSLMHETGHTIANRLFGQPEPKELAEYNAKRYGERAVKAAAKVIHAQSVEGPVSSYAMQSGSKAEDFADMVRLHIKRSDWFAREYPKKSEAVSELLKAYLDKR